MDIILAMLANNAAQKINSEKWERFPYSVERNAEISERTQNSALYRYLINSALRYPKQWIDDNSGAKVMIQAQIVNKDIIVKNIDFLSKTESLEEDMVIGEVEKTLQRAKSKFPQSKSPVELEFMLEWKSRA